jgi:hypothetical protein
MQYKLKKRGMQMAFRVSDDCIVPSIAGNSEGGKPLLRGEGYLIRYADDFICAFEKEDDAKRFQAVLPKRLGQIPYTKSLFRAIASLCMMIPMTRIKMVWLFGTAIQSIK